MKANMVLQILDLGDNKIGPEGAKALREAFKVNTVLKGISLWNNELGLREKRKWGFAFALSA